MLSLTNNISHDERCEVRRPRDRSSTGQVWIDLQDLGMVYFILKSSVVVLVDHKLGFLTGYVLHYST